MEDPIPKGLNYTQTVMAEEVVHRNKHVRILPTQEIPGKLPPIEDLVPIYHKICGNIAFYYTHVIQDGEMMTASRARTVKGKRIEKGSAFVCGGCAGGIDPSHLFVRKTTWRSSPL